MYHHSSSLALAAELYFETVYKNEDKMPGWLMAALKTPNNPAVIDDIIVTANFSDIYGEEEFAPAPSYNRDDYKAILKKDTKARDISCTDEMLISFLDVGRKFRADFTLHMVLFSEGETIRAIDVLDVNVRSANLDSASDEQLVNWFLLRRQDAEAYINRFRDISPSLRVVVDHTH